MIFIDNIPYWYNSTAVQVVWLYNNNKCVSNVNNKRIGTHYVYFLTAYLPILLAK